MSRRRRDPELVRSPSAALECWNCPVDFVGIDINVVFPAEVALEDLLPSVPPLLGSTLVGARCMLE
ncbi:hypothetical protein ACTXT7_004991 [Hymenolepis weldensis]